MNFPTFLHQNVFFQQLLSSGIVHLPHTNRVIRLFDNLFGEKSLIIDDGVNPDNEPIHEYVSHNNESQHLHFREVVIPLVDALEEEGRRYILKESMDLEKIWNYETFQEFLTKNTYDSPTEQVTLSIHEVITDQEGNYYSIHDLEDNFSMEEIYGAESELEMVYALFDEYNYEVLSDWKRDKQVRLRVVTGTSQAPNVREENMLLADFEHLEALASLDALSSYTPHYSDVETKEFAFNIKVYESFVHPGLYKLGLLGDNDEWSNREEAIESFVHCLEENELLKEAGFSHVGCNGRGGGYLVIKLDTVSVAIFQKLDQMIQEAKKEDYKYFQTLESVEHRIDDIVEELLELKETEDDEEHVALIDSLLAEIKKAYHIEVPA